ncbi:tyrosine-type recombinase/integrase [Sphingobium sp. CAP-1]|uniref:tyrosine-type recombinase/integrase n=1 Tax=Sphingobium sp. CAP-1 TaxID=2676077 RepID=UPI0012BB420D|nr:site-specific integrase [Sphingobium sp. CAP-1]QGP77778.1 tyrosine-type recombinase/integrase [Sphingobium sp. CAP-1]
MPNAKLDAAFCLTAQCEPGKRKTDYYDTVITGFVLEARSSGGKTFRLRYNRGKEKKEITIAGYGDLTMDKVRKEAQRLRSEVVLGRDPAAEKAEKRAVVRYSELADQHLDYAKSYQKRPENTRRILELHLIPRWGKLRLDEITQPAVAKWLAEKAGEGLAPATVEKLRVTLNRSFELAIRWDMPGVTKNPVKGIPRKPIENKRERYVSAAEAKRLLAACEASLNPQLKHIVGLLLLTGARVSELLHAEWRHIDLEKRQWLIPTSKTGRARHVPLSQPAIAILKAVPRFNGCPYVVPNPETRKPFVTIKHAWQTAREEAVLPDLRIHDLRHSAASFMINAGIDLFAVGRVLGHADHKSTMRYSHLANDTLLAAVEAGAKKMKGSPTLR